MTLIPVFVFAISKFMLKEQIRLPRVAGLIIALLGTVFIVSYSARDVSVGSLNGDLLLVTNSFSFSVYLVIVRPLMQRYSSLTVTKWVFFLAFLMVLPVGWGEAGLVDWTTLPPVVWWGIAYVVLFATIAVYVMNNWALKKVKASTVSVYVYTQPIFATSVAVLFFDEKFTLFHLLAASMIFGGAYLVTRKT